MEDGETDSLVREARRLETASSIIQEIHGSLDLDRIVEGVVENLVEVAGFAGAAIKIDARIEQLKLDHTATYGELGDDIALKRTVPLAIRGELIGELKAYFESAENAEEQSNLLEFILPTLFMAIDHAVSFAEVLDYRATLELKV